MPGVGGLVGSGGSSFIGTLHTTIYIIFTLYISIYTIGIPPPFLYYYIYIHKKILSYFYYILVVCFSALILDSYIQFFTGINIIGLPKTGARLSSFFGDELILGSYLSRLFPLLFALYLLKEKSPA